MISLHVTVKELAALDWIGKRADPFTSISVTPLIDHAGVGWLRVLTRERIEVAYWVSPLGHVYEEVSGERGKIAVRDGGPV